MTTLNITDDSHTSEVVEANNYSTEMSEEPRDDSYSPISYEELVEMYRRRSNNGG